MLQYIEHEDQRIPLAGLELIVKRADMNPLLPRIIIAHQGAIRLNPVDFAKLAKTIEEESVAAPHIKYRPMVPVASDPVNDGGNQTLSCTPPPVPIVKLSILTSVVLIHGRPTILPIM
jgi:hypothetical protein